MDGALSKSTGLGLIYIFYKDFFLIHFPVDGCAGEYCLTCKEGWFRINHNKRRCLRKCPKGFYTFRSIQNYCLSKYILFCIIISPQQEMLDSIAQKEVSDPAGISTPTQTLFSRKPLGTARPPFQLWKLLPTHHICPLFGYLPHLKTVFSLINCQKIVIVS